MAVSTYVEGSQSVTNSEWSMVIDDSGPTTETDAGVYQVLIDLTNVAGGDSFRIRIYEKVTSDGTQRVVMESTVTGPQGNPVWISPALMLLNGWDMTLYKSAGTDRTITWSIRTV